MAKVDYNFRVLEQDMKKYMRTFAKEYCNQAANEITNLAKLAIEQFYIDYTPTCYQRTDNLKKSYIRFFKNTGRQSYVGGVRITSEKMEDYDYSIYSHTYATPALEVAQLAWHGWHGNPTGYNGVFEPIFTTPPLDIVRSGINEKLLNKLKDKAFTIAKREKYTKLKIE